MTHQTHYSKETYSGMSTIAGFLAGMILLCNRLIIPIRIATQALLFLCYVSVCLACYRIYDSLKDRSIIIPHGQRIRNTFLTLLSLFLILLAIAILIVIPLIPLFFKSVAAGLGNILWLRLQLHLLQKGADPT